jgi:uncharacterized BrkB/YihY/UPF0761 family membrane protein
MVGVLFTVVSFIIVGISFIAQVLNEVHHVDQTEAHFSLSLFSTFITVSAFSISIRPGIIVISVVGIL